jgi:hypothetical protein
MLSRVLRCSDSEMLRERERGRKKRAPSRISKLTSKSPRQD